MKAIEVTEILKKEIANAGLEAGSPLRGVNVETDPYAQLENILPFVLIEEGTTQIITNPQGFITEYLHSIDVTCAVNTANEERGIYKRKTSVLAEGILNVLMNISDYRIKLFPREIKPGDVQIGSIGCSAVKLTIEVRTLFKDE
jgi:hypothetical protein